MERKDEGIGVVEGLLYTLGGAAGVLALALLCSEPTGGGPMTWGFILATKVGGLALLLLTGLLYDRTWRRYGGGRDDRA